MERGRYLIRGPVSRTYNLILNLNKNTSDCPVLTNGCRIRRDPSSNKSALGLALCVAGKVTACHCTWVPVHILAVPPPFYLPAIGLGNADEDGPSVWAAATHVGNRDEVLALA